MVPYIEKYWKNLGKQRKLVELYSNIPSNNTEEAQDNKPYVEYIQKHALVDIMFNSFIQDNFMDFDFLPFNGIGLFNWQASISSTREYWNHFYSKYMTQLKNISLSTIEKEEHDNRLKYQENFGDSKIFE